MFTENFSSFIVVANLTFPFVPRDPRSLETMAKLASVTKEQTPDIKSDNSESVGPASNNSSVRLFKSCLAWKLRIQRGFSCLKSVGFFGICTSEPD